MLHFFFIFKISLLLNSVIPRAVKAVKQKVHKAINKTKKAVKQLKTKVDAKVKEVNEKITKTIKEVDKKINDKIDEIKEDINSRNTRILEKVKGEWDKFVDRTIRGKTIVGAFCAILDPRTAFRGLDFVLQARKALIEEYPTLFPSNVAKGVVSGIKNIIVGLGQGAGSAIYELDIPGLSDFIGEFTKVREEGAESNIASTLGAFAHGVIVKGVGGTVEGIANLVADPIAAVEGINKILAYPEETIPAICSGV
ncbi:MAG: hypothetical protein N4A64_11090, partial [Marinisporobacter sp.]|nr:hypothetical protein [Marinisporobacter sp.]